MISPERFKAHVAYLASNRLQGRGPGTEGKFLASEYLAAQRESRAFRVAT